MNLRGVDLNLLGVFDAIFETRSVTLAAARFGITQPAMSNALARLRRLCGDALFVATPSGMQPTPYALEIAVSVKQALHGVESVLGHRRSFDPTTSERTFRFHLTDMGQTYFLPLLLEHLRGVAPRVQVEAETLPFESLGDALAEGRIDFALGRLPRFGGASVKSKKLFVDRYDVLLRSGHPAGGKRLTRKAFLDGSHAIVRSASGGHKVLEETLIRLRARIAIRVTNFMVIPMILSRTDAMATVPARLAAELIRTTMFERHPLPIAIPTFEVSAFWHERFDGDPAIAWMRHELYELFGERERTRAVR
ncbi:MAG: LysR family transcriptional regulator [Sulfurifustis sp.]